jgi:hypothetical protein
LLVVRKAAEAAEVAEEAGVTGEAEKITQNFSQQSRESNLLSFIPPFSSLFSNFLRIAWGNSV